MPLRVLLDLLGALFVYFVLHIFSTLAQQRLDRCFDGTNFVAGSQGCADEAGSLTTQSTAVTAQPICEAFFGTEPTAADVATNTHPCYMPDNKPMASKCRHRCKTCCLLPNYGSCDDQPSGEVPCTQSICAVERFAVKVCPRTCGRCVDHLRAREETKYCDDEEETGNCVMLKESGLCTSSDAAAMCALTCNDPQTNNKLCEQYTRSVSAAVTAMTGRQLFTALPNGDLSEDCATNKHLCDNEFYKDLMRRYCEGTCAGGGSECADRSENCLHWKRNGFCENQFYSLETRTDECGETCGLC
uniref:ShKT domain-containing protein n=1 Tax=Globodera pallida TaxID=36090 RepID=A0A183BN58_GLOPA